MYAKASRIELHRFICFSCVLRNEAINKSCEILPILLFNAVAVLLIVQVESSLHCCTCHTLISIALSIHVGLMGGDFILYGTYTFRLWQLAALVFLFLYLLVTYLLSHEFPYT